jgi:hypothetical protein
MTERTRLFDQLWLRNRGGHPTRLIGHLIEGKTTTMMLRNNYSNAKFVSDSPIADRNNPRPDVHHSK